MAIISSEGKITAVAPGTHNGWGYVRNLDYEHSSSDDLSDFASIWRTQPNVRTVVSFLARNIGQIALHAYRRDGLDRVRVDSGPLADLLSRPNPVTPWFRFAEALVSDLAVFDNAIIGKIKSKIDGKFSLFRFPPQSVRPCGGSWLYADNFEIRGSKGVFTVRRDEVIHLHGYNPSDNRWGHSPLATLKLILAEEQQAGRYRTSFWKNAARMEGVITRPAGAPLWGLEARSRFRESWQALYASSESAGKTAVLEEGMSFNPLSFSAKDAQYLEVRKLSREEVASAFHVSPAMVGILEYSNFSNIQMQHQMLYQDTLGPWLKAIEEDLELQLLPEFNEPNVYLEFNIMEKLKGSIEEQATQLQTAVGAPWLTRNEARARMNLTSIDGGDELVTPLNVLMGGQASPTDATNDANKSDGPDLAPERGVKALKEQPATWAEHRAAHEKLMTVFFERQGRAVLTHLGAGGSFNDFGMARWNRELGHDLYLLALKTSEAIGADAVEELGGPWGIDVADAFLASQTEHFAESINVVTLNHLQEATGKKARGFKDEEEPEPVDPLVIAAGLYAMWATSRSPQIAATQTTRVGNFTRHDVADKAGLGKKVWIVTNPKSRHPHMNREAVPMGTTFSNGAQWPGDPTISIDETANCQCMIDFA